MKQIVVGVLANVDAGKTTLSEALLYQSGVLRKLGRVDNGDAFLDTEALEKKRGITIFAHQAELTYQDLQITLLDTPGHVDFASQTEQVLQVLDYAILVISGTAGIQAYTKILWDLLEKYHVPTFVFVNKMDAVNLGQNELLKQEQKTLAAELIPFTEKNGQLSPATLEEIALQEETVLSDYLENGKLADAVIQKMIQQRKIFPVYFGSGLKLAGINEFLAGLARWTVGYKAKTSEFGGRVFKISHNPKGERLTWLRVMSGTLKPKQTLLKQEKINEIYVYQGEKRQAIQEVAAGQICTIPGMKETYPGQGLGMQPDGQKPVIEPVLNYVVDTKDYDPLKCLAALQEIQDEDRELHVSWSEHEQEIQVRIMGEVQLEVLQQLLLERFNLDLAFGKGKILYKETVTAAVEGVGHFEPLRHYAETHLILQPLPAGSGLVFADECPDEVLAPNWQKQVMSDLKNKEHLGVLIGAPLTDMKITLISGHYNYKHTQGGDFRKATWRAVRQGLMLLRAKDQCQLLEPWYRFKLTVDQDQVGHAFNDINDIEQMHGKIDTPEMTANGQVQTLTGTAPVAQMQNYAQKVRDYTHGKGQLECVFDYYYPCQNAAEIIAAANYVPTHDLANTPDSVFCPNEIATRIPWDEVAKWAHVPYQKKYKNGGYPAYESGL
ncbi:TetM/TetW/TetO/TetS family tetracycline resistance ribosomal protection protein [Lactobacillus sp. ESL0791]|uniref:elongation factor G n=1 Tax=Lactobacillus sp. ESL0791 TaxID=2983234 RepID=UPI0023F902EA|nr:TetM/TetW/TetO/TetS family tetracycline resistance ribosomal protection protein [Lactobacillus sp. ESL0791]MDF7639415.1 TetM/TetW/TetO/TetS family tetracycline resistance ribosomal protection protein [Lactobacillus sp. ESL0791]